MLDSDELKLNDSIQFKAHGNISIIVSDTPDILGFIQCYLKGEP